MFTEINLKTRIYQQLMSVGYLCINGVTRRKINSVTDMLILSLTKFVYLYYVRKCSATVCH